MVEDFGGEGLDGEGLLKAGFEVADVSSRPKRDLKSLSLLLLYTQTQHEGNSKLSGITALSPGEIAKRRR